MFRPAILSIALLALFTASAQTESSAPAATPAASMDTNRLTATTLSRYYRTFGGSGRIARVQSIQATGEIFYFADESTHSFRLFKKRPNLLRFELDIGLSTAWILASTGEEVWRAQRVGDRMTVTEWVQDPVERAQVDLETEFDGPLWHLFLRERTASIEIDPERPYLYRCTVSAQNEPENQPVITVFLQRNNLHEVERHVRWPDGTTSVSEFSEIQIIGGIPFPQTIVTRVNGQPVSRATTTSIQLNVGTLDIFFQAPDQ